MAGAFLAPDRRLALAALLLANFGSCMAFGPLFATVQTLVAPRMRATSVALMYLCANLIGMGLGPLAAGALSDALSSVFGVESLRFALVILCPGYLWAAWHAWSAGKTVIHDLKVAQVREAAPAQNPVQLAVATDGR
jgi:MFS transporter, Spinster family, sphingosine-1-phosphate transporter